MTAKFKMKRGFTLIETLVAVMILATAVAGPLSIASRALNTSLVAKDQITAFFLAQDAVEYVRFVRDTNTLEGNDWLSGTGGATAGIDLTPCQGASGCYVDSTMAVSGVADTPTACDSGSGCPVMYYDNTNSRFTYDTGGSNVSKTLFTRTILLNNISATEQQLTVTISWSDLGGVTRRVNVYENLFQWQG
ncbi:MAG TPA: type II secretion system protein [Candidatus Paceibacterota bacterium]|nr:type II secretion system protein [Candidatus Paceibacterota bacterium]